MNLIEQIGGLVKALEAGNYDAAPSRLQQGAALQVEDLSDVMHNVTFDQDKIKLQKMLKVESCKSQLAQFNRQLSYGIMGGAAAMEGGIGQEETSDYVRVTVPMAYYSELRRVTLQANLVETVDGVKAEERAASDAAIHLAANIEFDCFRGMADFSNAGVFDGNPLTIADLPNMHGLDLQVRQSDNQRSSRDLMFSEFGSDETVVLSQGGVLTQETVEDASVRSALNWGEAEKLIIDPRSLSAYNKLAFGISRNVLAGQPLDATGADLRKQWVSGGTVSIEASHFLRGKYKPAPARANGPLAPASISPASTTDATAPTAFTAGQVYIYTATSCNELGESLQCASQSVTIGTTADKVVVTINHPASGTVRFFNVYRTVAGGAAGTQKFIGRVVITPGANSTTFTDLGNKLPGFVTGFLIEGDTMMLKELASYSRVKLAVTDLSMPEAHFRFCTLAVTEPRKNVLIDNLK
jgi:hypothetical protein